MRELTEKERLNPDEIASNVHTRDGQMPLVFVYDSAEEMDAMRETLEVLDEKTPSQRETAPRNKRAPDVRSVDVNAVFEGLEGFEERPPPRREIAPCNKRAPDT